MHGGEVTAQSDGRQRQRDHGKPTACDRTSPCRRFPAPSSLELTQYLHAVSSSSTTTSTRHSLSPCCSTCAATRPTCRARRTCRDRRGTLAPGCDLLDIGLPRLNGLEACRQIRQRPWSKDVVIIALTGWGQEVDRRRSQGVRLRPPHRQAGRARDAGQVVQRGEAQEQLGLRSLDSPAFLDGDRQEP